MNVSTTELANVLVLGDLLDSLAQRWGGYELVAHWQEGEYHHDLVIRVRGGELLLVSTNCNGGIKELLAFAPGASVPSREAIWAYRRQGAALSGLREASRTLHWCDPAAA
jgi:hypothetical protein